MLVTSDIPMDQLVNKVTVDLLNHDVQLSYSKCQTISSDARLTFICVSNKFAEKPMTSFLWSCLNQIQKAEHKGDPNSELGLYKACGKTMPKIVLKKDFPYIGVWEAWKEGVDMGYTIVWILMCAMEDIPQVERALKIYKHSGLLKEDFGQHATAVRAPEKDAENETGKEKYHEMLQSGHSVELSMGILSLDNIVNPDIKVPVAYWKRNTHSSTKRHTETPFGKCCILSPFRAPRAQYKCFRVCAGKLMVCDEAEAMSSEVQFEVKEKVKFQRFSNLLFLLGSVPARGLKHIINMFQSPKPLVVP
jgi:hypothetical protein